MLREKKFVTYSALYIQNRPAIAYMAKCILYLKSNRFLQKIKL